MQGDVNDEFHPAVMVMVMLMVMVMILRLEAKLLADLGGKRSWQIEVLARVGQS